MSHQVHRSLKFYSQLCQCNGCEISGDVLATVSTRLVVLCRAHRLELDADKDVAAFGRRLEEETHVLNAMTKIAGEQREFQGLRRQVQILQDMREQAYACIVSWMGAVERAAL